MSVHLDGQILREHREELGLSLHDVAQRAGVTRQYVSSVEHNKVQLIPPGIQRITQTVGLGIRFDRPDANEQPLHFFTYGTMKPGFSRSGVVEATNPQDGVVPALLAGFEMYDTRMGYPGIVRTRQPGQLVHGFLYRYTPKTIDKALKIFDVIEGVNDDPPLFRQCRTVAITAEPNDDGDDIVVPCWVYLLVETTRNMRVVKDGIWKQT